MLLCLHLPFPILGHGDHTKRALSGHCSGFRSEKQKKKSLHKVGGALGGLTIKVHIFSEGNKILQNLPLTFDCMYCSQKLGEDLAKFCGLLRIYEL